MRKAQSREGEISRSADLSLIARAIEALNAAAAAQVENDAPVIEERAVWQPDSWLLQRCWHELAQAGAGQAALQVAVLLESRSPLARVQALFEVARHAGGDAATASVIAQETVALSRTLLQRESVETVYKYTEQLLYAGATAAQLGNLPLACACLERLDQLDRPWDRIFIPMESRQVLAETVVRIGLHPLTNQLLSMAIRRYEEPGAHFLHQVMRLSHARLSETPVDGVAARRMERRLSRLMQRCADVFQFSTLATLTSRRLAATAFGQMGYVREVLEQVETIANVQSARQETGLGGGRGDPHFLRQVKRPTANPDVDFQAYTLQEAIKAMPLRKIKREDRIVLADRVAALATKSDGWTAAGAVATLVELGALRYAVQVMDFIPPTDATRSEGVISLVRALLSVGEFKLAHEQVEKAIVWARSLPGRNPERALIWGLAEVYMEHDRPARAVELLDLRVAPPSFGRRVRRLFRNAPNDDELRDNRLRLRALIQQDSVGRAQGKQASQVSEAANGAAPALQPEAGQGSAWNNEKEALLRQLSQWAPRLLDGEALINFYVDGLLRPLFAAGEIQLVIQLLPQIRTALHHTTGDKHTVHIRKIATLLAQSLHTGDPIPQAAAGGGEDRELAAAFTDFLVDLWATDATRGVWQIVHSVEGSLPLLLALEGPDVLTQIALYTVEYGQNWSS